MWLSKKCSGFRDTCEFLKAAPLDPGFRVTLVSLMGTPPKIPSLSLHVVRVFVGSSVLLPSWFDLRQLPMHPHLHGGPDSSLF